MHGQPLPMQGSRAGGHCLCTFKMQTTTSVCCQIGTRPVPIPSVSLEIHVLRRTVMLHQVQAVEDESGQPDRCEKLQQGC